MSRITIFALKGCPHCIKAKALFADKGWEYTEISLTDYPEKRTDMLQLCDRLTVPQIFFGTHHVGGGSDVFKLQDENELDALYEAKVTNGDLEEVISNPKLQKPDYEPKQDPEFINLAELQPMFLVCSAKGGECLSKSYTEIVNLLLENIQVRDVSDSFFMGRRTHQKVFHGRDLLACLLKNPTFECKKLDALELAQRLLDAGIFYDVKAAAEIEKQKKKNISSDTWKDEIAGMFNIDTIYRFQAHDVTGLKPLNCYFKFCPPDGCLIESGAKSRDPMLVLKKAKGALGSIISKHTNADGLVDYVAVGKDGDYDGFRTAISEFQVIDYNAMDSELKKPFSINIYNMIVIHAFIELGIAETDLTRLHFFNSAAYQLGDYVYTLNEIENGIVRGNKAGPAHLLKPFKSSDPRIAGIIPQPTDFRVHFGLNCGAKSCPPVKWFSKEAADEELRIVAQAFCEDDGNLLPDPEQGVLWTSKILGWYSADFTRGKQRAGELLLPYCRGEKKAKMEELLKKYPKYKLKYFNYDWSTNSGNHKVFAAFSLWSLSR